MMKTLILSLTTSLFQQSVSQNAAKVTKQPTSHKDHTNPICPLFTLAKLKETTRELSPVL